MKIYGIFEHGFIFIRDLPANKQSVHVVGDRVWVLRRMRDGYDGNIERIAPTKKSTRDEVGGGCKGRCDGLEVAQKGDNCFGQFTGCRWGVSA